MKIFRIRLEHEYFGNTIKSLSGFKYLALGTISEVYFKYTNCNFDLFEFKEWCESTEKQLFKSVQYLPLTEKLEKFMLTFEPDYLISHPTFEGIVKREKYLTLIEVEAFITFLIAKAPQRAYVIEYELTQKFSGLGELELFTKQVLDLNLEQTEIVPWQSTKLTKYNVFLKHLRYVLVRNYY